MMYEFTDTNAQPGSRPLPAEAMSYGGVYIENSIAGYRTLYVEGREAISASFDYTDIKVRDGARYRSRHYEPRTLIVGFQLIKDTPDEFMEAFNSLLFILSKEEAQVIFADEPDKYYVGTKAKIEGVPPGKLAVTGEIEIFCADPFKYGLTEKTVTAQVVEQYTEAAVTVGGSVTANTYYEQTTAYSLTSDIVFAAGKTYYTKNGNVYTAATVTAGSAVTANTYYEQSTTYTLTSDAAFASGKTYYTKDPDQNILAVNYAGTYPAHPIISAVSEDHDNGFYAFVNQSEKLIQIGNPEEIDRDAQPSAEQAVTVLNSFMGASGYPANTWDATDAVLSKYPYHEYGGFTVDTNYLYCHEDWPPGAEPYSDYFFGPAWGYDLGEDACPHFECSFLHWFEPHNAQGGGFDLYINDSEGHLICGISIWHNQNGPIKWAMLVGEETVKTGSFALDKNPFRGKWASTKISKMGDQFTFSLGGVQFSTEKFYLAETEAANVTFIMYLQPGAGQIDENNALKKVLFRMIPDPWEVYNVIAEGEAVEVDTGSGEITVDGRLQMGLGALGNAFEDFVLTPGTNTILCAASDWVDDAVYTMRYREVFL